MARQNRNLARSGVLLDSSKPLEDGGPGTQAASEVRVLPRRVLVASERNSSAASGVEELLRS
jgi:hypothetical protein